MNLIPVTEPAQVEWLRVQRSRPEVYKYFRQDKPLTVEDQQRWWKSLNKTRIRQYMIQYNRRNIGCVQFYPLNSGAHTAEFGIFVIPEYQGKGHARAALHALLKIGFEDMGLKNVYSDCLDYPGEDRFGFYEKFGFSRYPPEHCIIRYKKQGVMIPSIKFFMTKEMWDAKSDH